jgi:hypothetical protein
MNLPSSLALSKSNFFQSRLGILVLALVGLAIAGGVLLLRQKPEAPVMPTPATSPAAQALSKPAQKSVYGPPAPVWARNDIQYGPAAPAEFLISGALPPPPAKAGEEPATIALTPDQAASTATAQPTVSVPTVPGQAAAPVGTAVGEVPKSVDASVLFARERYEYIAGGRRDPFQSLLDGKFQTQTADGSLIDVGDIHLVGIMWGSSDKFALVEDSRGHGYVLRVGDPVLNGYISGISKSELQVVQNAFGESQTLSIQLQTKEGDKNATRN